MRTRKLAVGGFSGAVGVVLMAAVAWACVSGPAVTLSTVNAAPGDEITISGSNFRQPESATVRWDSLDGQILANLGAPDNRLIEGTFTVPANATPGNHVVIVSQAKADGTLTQMPIRALLTVTPAGGAAPVLGESISPTEVREPGLVTADDGISTGSLVLIALGVAGTAMFLAGVAALVAGRRSPAPAAAKVRS